MENLETSYTASGNVKWGSHFVTDWQQFKYRAIVCCCCCFSFTKSCPTLCKCMNCSIPGFPVLHYLLEFAQTHVYRVGDAIQPSYPLSPLSPPALNLSQHQGLFQRVGSWSFRFSISPFSEYSGLISFRPGNFHMTEQFYS